MPAPLTKARRMHHIGLTATLVATLAATLLMPQGATLAAAAGPDTGSHPIATGAKAGGAAILMADRIVFTTGHKVLRASGHVSVSFGNMILTASAITYDETSNTIIAEGPLRLRNGDTATIVASYAELSSDMRKGVLKSARMVLNRQMQITATEIRRSDGRYTQLYHAAASTCRIANAHQTPFWQVRARRIVHDEQRKLLFFERAQLRLGGLPVAYLPRIKVPDPSVKRASGFLVPGVSNSDKLGFGVSAPYFVTLGDYADVTLKPRLYSSGTATLGFDFRRRFRHGRLSLTGALTNDTRMAYRHRGYLFATGNWRFQNGLEARAKLQLTSDRSYLVDHGFSSATRLENRISLARTRRNSRTDLALLGYRTLSTSVPGDTIPYLLGHARYRKRLETPVLGGQLALGAELASYRRRARSNITGRDGRRLGVVLDWSRQWIGRSGLIVTTSARGRAERYEIAQDSTYPAPITRTISVASLDLRLPMARRSTRATESLEPRLQLVYAPGGAATVPNEDSQIVPFEANNLFTLNRFPGHDIYEQGFRANIGVSYSRQSKTGFSMNLVAGKVFRLGANGQFSAASGLAGASSGLVLAGRLSLPKRLNFVQRLVLGGGGGGAVIRRAETRLAYKTRRLDLDTSYLWLLKGAAGNTAADVSDWSVKAGWLLGNNWRTVASWRYDATTAKASDAGLALTYRNDCIKIDLSLSRQYASSSNVGASSSLGLKITLDGFGARANSGAFARQCASF